MPFDEKHQIYGVLYRARNNAGFQFDHGDFVEVIRRVFKKFGADAETTFVFEREPDGGDRGPMYYMLANQIALEVSYGLRPPEELDVPGTIPKALETALDLHAALSTFLEEAVAAYCRLRRIPAAAFRSSAAD